MNFLKTEIIVKSNGNLMGEACLFSNIHFRDFLAETVKTGGQKGTWSFSMVVGKIFGGKRREERKC